MASNSSGFKSFVAKAFARNPVSAIIFLVFNKRVSFNHLTIRIISILLRQRFPFHKITIDVSDKVILPLTKSLLYYEVYEKNEVNFVKKYLSESDDVIELGSSIGVMGSIISNIQTSGRYISVEADPSLINANRKNLSLNRKTDYVLINKAVDYFNKTVSFASSKSTLAGKVSHDEQDSMTITVETITLNEICNTYNLNNFTLVCDIEGAEITIILNDKLALGKCKKMIIELHNTEYNGKTYLIEDMVNLLIDESFKLLDQHGSVYVFQKI
jgi:FkbM family methyltransferase